jgi:hypothetical protein
MNEPPGILSRDFHFGFLPRLLRSRLDPGKAKGGGTSFGSGPELTVALFVSLVLGALGAPMAAGGHPVAGWILCGAGLAGILFILLHSIRSQRGSRPSYDGFLAWIFLFFALGGPSAGWFWASVHHFPRAAGAGTAVLGFALGYAVGIAAGFWTQAIGWVSGLLNGLAGLAIVGILVVDVLLLVA